MEPPAPTRGTADAVHAALPGQLLLSAIVDSSDDAILSKSLDGTITSWNRAAERIFGYKADEMIGKSVLQLIPRELHEDEPRIIEQLRRGQRIEHFETLRLRKDGSLVQVSLTISPIKDATGTVIGASKVARDVTREKKALEQLALANAELKRADELKSEFLALMSHELRTPLNSIIGFAAVLRRGMLTDGQKRQLDLIYNSGNHLLQLINDMLDLSRIEAGRMELEAENFSVKELLFEAVRTLELAAAQKNLEIRHETKGIDRVLADRKRIFQVLLNLIGNAVKFTPSGSVEVYAQREGANLVFSVKDTGVGIPLEKQNLLFQPFSRLESSFRRRFEGTGLGLYLCKRLVGLLGGGIWLESAPGKGSTFSFSIPIEANKPAVKREVTLQATIS